MGGYLQVHVFNYYLFLQCLQGFFVETLQPGAEAAVDKGFGVALVGGKVIGDHPSAHGLYQDGVEVKVVEAKEVLAVYQVSFN